jgi:hypothetical protein
MADKGKSKTKEKLSKDLQSELDRELADTFPASDPPSVTQPGTGTGAPDHKRAPKK